MSAFKKFADRITEDSYPQKEGRGERKVTEMLKQEKQSTRMKTSVGKHSFKNCQFVWVVLFEENESA